MNTNKEHQVDHLIHYTLLAGVSMSAILLVAGLFTMLARGTPQPEVTLSPGEILHQAFMANGVGLIYLGLLLLMITPVARVVMLVYGYARIGWWPFALISLLVLLLLGTGLALGIKG
ncbi:MAG TPA: DUF1634 domain-containing protein [Anaerolineae bacterium]|nr:DUF1634 domain-containing protein [Anaerolineae bacterium]